MQEVGFADRVVGEVLCLVFIRCGIPPSVCSKRLKSPQAVVQELVGHDSEQMSALYTHVGRETLERAAAALPEILNTR